MRAQAALATARTNLGRSAACLGSASLARAWRFSPERSVYYLATSDNAEAARSTFFGL